MAGTETSGTSQRAQAAGGSDKYYPWIVLLVTAVTYLGTLKFDFVSDDYPLIVSDPFIKAWHYLPQYFPDRRGDNCFRPRRVASTGRWFWFVRDWAMRFLATALSPGTPWRYCFTSWRPGWSSCWSKK